MTTGERIRYRRQQLGISVRDLAERLGVSHGAITKWENNQTKGIPDQHFAALAEILDCNVLWLVGMDDAIKTDSLHHPVLKSNRGRLSRPGSADGGPPVVRERRAFGSGFFVQ